MRSSFFIKTSVDWQREIRRLAGNSNWNERNKREEPNVEIRETGRQNTQPHACAWPATNHRLRGYRIQPGRFRVSNAGGCTSRRIGLRRAVCGGRFLRESREPALDVLFFFGAGHAQILAQLVFSLIYSTASYQNLGEEQPGI